VRWQLPDLALAVVSAVLLAAALWLGVAR
jgi:hypothetical protein